MKEKKKKKKKERLYRVKTCTAFRLYAAQEFAEIFVEQTYGDASGCKRA